MVTGPAIVPPLASHIKVIRFVGGGTKMISGPFPGLARLVSRGTPFLHLCIHSNFGGRMPGAVCDWVEMGNQAGLELPMGSVARWRLHHTSIGREERDNTLERERERQGAVSGWRKGFFSCWRQKQTLTALSP